MPSEKKLEPLKIVLYPDPVLDKKARPVTLEELKAGRAGTHNLPELVERMVVAMYENEGVGLAAPQVGVSLRLWVADTSKDRDQPVAVFNPELVEPAGTVEEEEGCLSLPEIKVKVKRHEQIKVRGLDLKGQPVELECDGLMSRVAQHETDHLDGILITKYAGTAGRFMLRGKLKALEEEYAFRNRRKK